MIKTQINLILDDITRLHTELEKNPDYPAMSGIRDKNLLESAVNAPFQTFLGQDLYPTIFEKAAQLLYGLNKNHGFIDGNKRISIHAMLVYLLINDIQLEYTQDELVSLSMSVANDTSTANDIIDWIKKHYFFRKEDD